MLSYNVVLARTGPERKNIIFNSDLKLSELNQVGSSIAFWLGDMFMPSFKACLHERAVSDIDNQASTEVDQK